MKIKQYDSSNKLELIKLIGQYRVSLSKLKARERQIDLKAAEEELEFYQKKILLH